MISLDLRTPIEQRSSTPSPLSYTEHMIHALQYTAAGINTGKIGAVETAAGWWGRSLASATVTPNSAALAGLTPPILEQIGRSLLTRGESVHVISVADGGVSLIPASSWDVRGDSRAWWYRCVLAAPDSSETVSVPGDSVLHTRYGCDVRRPWRGCSPLVSAAETLRGASNIEAATAAEFAFELKQLVTPDSMRADMPGGPVQLDGNQQGQLADSFAQALAHPAPMIGSNVIVPPEAVKLSRLGPEPPESYEGLRTVIEMSVYRACGLPPALLDPRAAGNSSREAYRQFVASTISPIGRLIEHELRIKLDAGAGIAFDALRSTDLTARARAFSSLTTGGATAESAAAAVGFDGLQFLAVPV